MKRKMAFLAVLMLLTAIPAALAQEQPRYVRIHEFKTKLGHGPEYEAGVKQLFAACAKAGLDYPIFGSVSVTNPGSYGFVIPMNSISDYDKQEPKLEAAFALAPEVMGQLSAITESNTSSIFAVRADLSYTPQTPRLAMQEQTFTRIAFLYPHYDQQQAFEGLLKDMAALYLKHNIGDGREVANVVFGADGPVYVSMQSAKSAADYYAASDKNREILGEAMQQIITRGGPMLRKIEYSEFTSRPDLSYMPAGQ